VTTYYDNLTATNSGDKGSANLIFKFEHDNALIKLQTDGVNGLPDSYDYIYIRNTDQSITLSPGADGQCIAPPHFTPTQLILGTTGEDPTVRTLPIDYPDGTPITTVGGNSYTLNIITQGKEPIKVGFETDEIPAWGSAQPGRIDNTETLHYIYDEKDLIAFAQAVKGGNFTLNALQMDNIKLEKEWVPIGTTYDTPYQGTYNGNGYTITGLKVSGNAYPYAGLFGRTRGATLVNIHLVEVSVNNTYSGTTFAGALAGYAYDTTIALCSSTGSVSVGTANNPPTFTYAGGLVGDAENTHITRSLSTCNVTATGSIQAYAGGLTGYTGDNSVIAACMAGGKVTADGGTTSYAGGFIGSSSTTITHCYATGTAEATVTGQGTPLTGGFAGYTYGGKILYSYTTQSSFFGANDGATLTKTWYKDMDADLPTPGTTVRADVPEADLVEVRTWTGSKVETVTFGSEIWTKNDYPRINYNENGTVNKTNE